MCIRDRIYSYDEKGNILIEKDLIENTIGIYKYNADGTVSESKEYLVEEDVYKRQIINYLN